MRFCMTEPLWQLDARRSVKRSNAKLSDRLCVRRQPGCSSRQADVIADRGWSGDGSFVYLDTTFAPTTAPSAKFILGSGSLANRFTFTSGAAPGATQITQQWKTKVLLVSLKLIHAGLAVVGANVYQAGDQLPASSWPGANSCSRSI